MKNFKKNEKGKVKIEIGSSPYFGTKPSLKVEIPAELRFLSDVELEKMGLGSARNRRNLRWLGRDPIPFVRVGKLIRYRLSDVLEYVEKNRVVSG